MIEKPLDNNITVDGVAEFSRALVLSGLPIVQMNTLRKHFSRVKGARLAVAAQGATQCTLLISDVPENALHIVDRDPNSRSFDYELLPQFHQRQSRRFKSVQ